MAGNSQLCGLAVIVQQDSVQTNHKRLVIVIDIDQNHDRLGSSSSLAIAPRALKSGQLGQRVASIEQPVPVFQVALYAEIGEIMMRFGKHAQGNLEWCGISGKRSL